MGGRLVILGGGESGVGAALLGKSRGYEVFLSDSGLLTDLYRDKLVDAEIPFEEMGHSESKILNAELIIKSPGIPKENKLIQKISLREIPIISEIEFASRFTPAKLIAVTGSNGKTTTASLIYHIMRQAGLNAGLGGNIGKSFAEQVVEDPFDYYVLELSSFQLDDIQGFRPYIAVLLNITPDHLDRYENKFELYANAKFKITKNQSDNDYFIFNFDDEKIYELINTLNTNAQKIPYSMHTKIENGSFLEHEDMIVTYPEKFEMPLSALNLKGRHNISNSMAAATTANILKIRKETIKRSLSDFHAVEHRLEFVLKVGGIEFINDSKATNVNSVYYALESMKNPTIWIVGGVDKGNDYSELYDLVKEKVKAIVCLGEDNSKIINAFAGKVEHIVETKSMHDAVNAAYRFGKKGDSVLLSPACASFDLFENYEDRGKKFKQEVKNL